MKYLGISLLLVISIVANDTDHTLLLPIKPITTQIHKRFYFIKRLQTTIDLLLKVENNLDQFPFLMRTIAWEYNTWQNTFDHSKVEDSIKELVYHRKLEPIFTLWESFTDYNALVDECLLDEFVKELFIITKSILINQIQEDVLFRHYPHGVTLCSCLNNAIELSAEQLVEVISLMSKACIEECKNIDYLCDEIRETLGLDMHKSNRVLYSIGVQEIVMRFYYVQRLSYLREFFKKIDSVTSCVHYEDDVYTFAPITFTNHCAQKAVEELEALNSTFPLIELLDDFQEYKNIVDPSYTWEVLCVCALALKNSLLNYSAQHKQDIPFNDNVSLIDTIEDASEDDLLEIIDSTVSLFQSLSIENSKRSNFISHSWYKKSLALWHSFCSLVRRANA